ncbi:MAG: hypothetical protein ACOVSW_24950 [Candidatus Kapaibacteriota bacterium]
MKRLLFVAFVGITLASLSSSCAQPRMFGDRGGRFYRPTPPPAYFYGARPGFVAPPPVYFAPRPNAFFAPRPWGWRRSGGWRRGC